MKDPCQTCKSTGYFRLQFRIVGKKQKLVGVCSECVGIKASPCYDDIYLGPGGGLKTDPNLINPKTGERIPFHTKQDKAVIMKMLGIKQANSAERQHGYRNEMYLHRKKYFHN